MTGQYSTRSFFSLMPNALLARYFNEKGLFGDIDFAVMKEGSLDLNIRGSKKPVEPLQGMFANAILKLDELPPDPKDERIYDLSLLLQRDFEFTCDVGSGIVEVRVKKLRLSSRLRYLGAYRKHDE
ncbi:MAG: hypothetical protein WA098_03310 [Smithella sp.]